MNPKASSNSESPWNLEVKQNIAISPSSLLLTNKSQYIFWDLGIC